MTRDLFGPAPGTTAKRSHRGQNIEWKPDPPPPFSPAPPASCGFYRCRSRTLSHAEVLQLAGFHEAVKAYPDHDVVVVLDTTGNAYTYLAVLPRNHPSRLDPDGKPDRAKAPFWRHGEIICIDRKEAAPP